MQHQVLDIQVNGETGKNHEEKVPLSLLI